MQAQIQKTFFGVQGTRRANEESVGYDLYSAEKLVILT